MSCNSLQIIGTLTTYLVILIQFSISESQMKQATESNQTYDTSYQVVQELAETTSNLVTICTNFTGNYGKCSRQECLALYNISGSV